MNRTEFMRQLERLLQSIPEMERQEALQYYNDYFDDAGEENEKEVIDALGNPAKVAENIKRDLYGAEAASTSTIKNPPVKYQDASNQDNNASKPKAEGTFWRRMGAKFDSLPIWGQVLIIIAGILLAPVIIGIVSTIIGAIFGLITGWFSMILGFAITAIVLIVVLFILVGTGIALIAEAPMGALAVAGVGLFCGGLGILFLMLTVAMLGIATPAIFKGIAKLWRKLFGKKEANV